VAGKCRLAAKCRDTYRLCVTVQWRVRTMHACVCARTHTQARARARACVYMTTEDARALALLLSGGGRLEYRHMTAEDLYCEGERRNTLNSKLHPNLNPRP
jgi:hypothetical protein